MSRTRTIPTIALLALALSGCTQYHQWRRQGKVGPNHQQPEAVVASTWQSCNSPELIATENAVDDTCWWMAFGDPQLQELVEVAAQGNLPLRAALLRIQEQSLAASIKVGNLLPQQQQAYAQYSRTQFSNNGNLVGIPGLGNSFDLYDVGFRAAWELDLWGRLRRLAESSCAERDIAVEDSHDLRLCLVADVGAVYTTIRALQHRLVLARDQVAAQQETLRIAEARFKNGSTTMLDVTQARAIVESMQAAIPRLQSELQQANHRLCVLLGQPPQLVFDEIHHGNIPSTPDCLVVGMPRDLLRRRPDIRRAERQVAAQCALIGVAAAELFPTFSLQGTINWQSFELSHLFESASSGGAIVPGVRWNILNYGRLKKNVCLRETQWQQAVLAYRQVVLEAHAEVESAMAAYLKKKEEITALRRAVEATRESLRIATSQYREGNTDLDRVNNLRKDLITQQDLEIAARGQAAIALIRIYKTMGGGWSFEPVSSSSVGECLGSPSADVDAVSVVRPTPSRVAAAHTRVGEIQRLDDIVDVTAAVNRLDTTPHRLARNAAEESSSERLR